MSATILIMDDEVGIRALLELSFRKHGYAVIAVADGPSALTCAAPFDAAVLDVDVPEPDGIAVAAQLLARNPGLPVWLMTGAWREDTLRRAAELDVPILRKPFKFKHVVAEVRRRLECAGETLAVSSPQQPARAHLG